MFKKKLSELEARKRLLVAESEINRMLLARDYEALAGGIYEATEPVRDMLSSATAVMQMVKSFRRNKSKSHDPKGSWWVNGLKTGWAIWSSIREQKAAMHSEE